MKRASLAMLLLLLGIAGLFVLVRRLDTPIAPLRPPGDRLSAGPGRTGATPPRRPERPRVRFSRRTEPGLGFEEAPYPFLADEDARHSVSVGTVTEGSLVNADEMALPGAHYRILPVQSLRNLRYSSEGLVALLRHAADTVAEEFPGSVLWLGNLSRRTGGDIAWSVSHNSGRDADVAFFFVDEAGELLAPPDLLPVDRHLRFTHEEVVYHFDVARNWSLVRALLTFDGAQIQFLFIADYLKAELLRFAREQDEPDALIARAQAVMAQPGRSNPHHDHLHVRIYCGGDDIAAGCVNTGRTHGWIDTFAGVRSRRLSQVRTFLAHEEPEQRARAVERLVIMDSRGDAPRFVPLLADESPRVRAAAARGLAWGGGPADLPALIETFESETDGEVLASLVDAMGVVGDTGAVNFLVQHLDEPMRVVLRGTEIDLRALIVDAIAARAQTGLAEQLVALLDSRDAYLRARALWALARLTNRELGRDFEDPRLDDETQEAACRPWRSWLEAHATEPRDSWLISGFMEAGYGVLTDAANPAERVDLTGLSSALQANADFLRHNAQRSLMGLLRRDPPSLTWPTSDAAWYWGDAVSGQ